jgi:hypothetical protein
MTDNQEQKKNGNLSHCRQPRRALVCLAQFSIRNRLVPPNSTSLRLIAPAYRKIPAE